MQIDSSGQVMIRRTTDFDSSNLYFLQVGDASLDNGTPIVSTVASTSSRKHIVFSNFSSNEVGSVTTSGSATAFNTSSDYRLKENVVEMTGALDRVSQLKPSRFNFIADEDKIVDGFLAHEVQDIVPEAITGEKDEMRTEEYEESPAVYEEIVHEASDRDWETHLLFYLHLQ